MVDKMKWVNNHGYLYYVDMETNSPSAYVIFGDVNISKVVKYSNLEDVNNRYFSDAFTYKGEVIVCKQSKNISTLKRWVERKFKCDNI